MFDYDVINNVNHVLLISQSSRANNRQGDGPCEPFCPSDTTTRDTCKLQIYPSAFRLL